MAANAILYCGLTPILPESLTVTATDDGESVGATLADDKSERGQ